MRIAVAGATGNTGVHVVKAIAAAGGHQVVAVTRDPEGKAAKELTSLPGVVAKKFEDAFDQPIDRAYLCVNSSIEHVLLETDFIVAAKKAGVKYIVKLSSIDKWLHHYTELAYVRTHLIIEYYLEKGDIPFTCLRANMFHSYIGVDIASAPATKQYRTSIAPGKAVASIDPKDIGEAAATLLLLEDPSAHYGRKYMLSGPKDETNETIGAALKEVLKLDDIKYTGTFTDEELVAFSIQFGLSKQVASAIPRSAQYFRDGKGCLTNEPTSPELIALGFPKYAFIDYVRRVYSQNN